MRAGLDEIHRPPLLICITSVHLACREIDGQVAGDVITSQKILFDIVPQIPQCDVKVTELVVREVLHDMPQDWLAADLDHRFRSRFGLLLQPCSHPTSEDDHFHRLFAHFA